MRIAFIIQRYGLEINGGAELHCRKIAEHLSKYYDVEVLTTRAVDYITWRNEYPEGEAVVNGITVRRFSIAKERDPLVFGLYSRRVFRLFHTKRAELKWMDLQGPYCPDLLDYLVRNEKQYDLLIFSTFRYWQTFHGLMRFPRKSFLIPNAENEQTIRLKIFKPFFRLPRAILYHTIEEKELINRVSGNHSVPSDLVGVGIDLPDRYDPDGFRKRHGLKDDYVLYLGRIDPNKGCPELFRFFQRFVEEEPERKVQLVLIGKEVIPIPNHAQIVHLGFVSEQEKFDALMGARFLIMSSQYESLSMVTLEAWFLSKAVLANGRCEVLEGQCRRSQGGLSYHNFKEFRAGMDYLLQNPAVTEQMGKRGRAYVEANYEWKTIEKKYIDLIKTFIGSSDRPRI